MRAASFALLLCLPGGVCGAEPPINLTPGAKATTRAVRGDPGGDAEFFKAFFDTCDVETVRRSVTDDFEMFHDKGGRVTSSGAEFVKITEDKCQRQAEGTDFLSARKLIKEIDEGLSRSTSTARSRRARIGSMRCKKTSPTASRRAAQFTQVWKEENGQWRLARVLSYDHRARRATGDDE